MTNPSDDIYFIMHFVAYHAVFLLTSFVAVGIASRTISQLQNSSAAYITRLPFAYCSLISWIFWVLQYVALIIWVLHPRRSDIFLIAMWMGFFQNALWTLAVLSLYSKQFSRLSLTLTAVIAFSPLIATLVGFRFARLPWGPYAEYEAVLCATIFAAFALSIRELRLSRLLPTAFFIYGLTQWLWRGLLFSSSFNIRLAILLVFPIWHLALLLSWRKLIPQFLQVSQASRDVLSYPHDLIATTFARSSEEEPRAQSQDVVPHSDDAPILPNIPPNEVALPQVAEPLLKPDSPMDQPSSSGPANESARDRKSLDVSLLTPFKVMISSTMEDLVHERNAVEKALESLNLDRFRAETYGSSPASPRHFCESWAKQCDVFILIIGKRYGFIIEEGVSATEFEYDTARKQNSEKILSYAKKIDDREDREQEFLEKVQHFDSGRVVWQFSTPRMLSRQVSKDVVQWLVERYKRSGDISMSSQQ